MTEVVLNVESVVAKTLATRETASYLFEAIPLDKPISTVVLDFDNVNFMSRSFADQLIKEQSNFLDKHHIVIQLKNIDSQIMDLIQTVARNQERNRSDSKNIPVLKIEDYPTLSKFMLSI